MKESNNIPFVKNQIINLDILDYNDEGEGVAKIDNFTFFIKDTVIGDKISAKVIKIKKNYAYAKLLDVLEPSKDRVSPKCEIARACGGCQLQASSYDLQLKFKQKKVLSNLKRIGKFDENSYEYENIIPMEVPFRYRNKAIFPISKNKDNEIISGFFARRSHCVIPVDDCLIGSSNNKEILKIILNFIKKYNISIYDEISNKGIVRNVLIREAFFTKEIMICLIINADKLKHTDILVEDLRKIKNIKSILLNINKEKTNVIKGNKIINLYGNGYIVDYIGDIKFRISALSFFQVNPSQTYKLYSKVLEYANLSKSDIVWDLYCGIGSISLFLAQKAKYVYGIEIIEEAIIDARNNAKINDIDNVKFYVGKAQEVLPRLYAKGNSLKENNFKADVIVVDPPRKGCDKICLDTMLKMSAKRIVYVSCDCATLARDLRYLCDNNYELKKVCIVDQFPHTTHVECVALLTRKDIDNILK